MQNLKYASNICHDVTWQKKKKKNIKGSLKKTGIYQDLKMVIPVSFMLYKFNFTKL